MRLWLSLLAYNLGNLWRRLALPAPIGKWSLTSLQQRLVKTGGRLIKHARYYWLLLVAAGGEPSDAAVVCRHAAEDRGAAVAGGMRRAQNGTDFVGNDGAQGEVSAESSGKSTFSGVACPPDAKPPPSGAAGNPSTNTG